MALIVSGIGHRREFYIPDAVDWQEVFQLSQEHGVAAIVLDGLEIIKGERTNISDEALPSRELTLKWIGMVLRQYEQRYITYEKNTQDLAAFYRKYGIRMMMIKGYGLSLNYPKPNHRPCGDMDIFLFGGQERADQLIYKELGIEVDKSHHHHTVFKFHGETVENHYDFLNVHVRPSNKRIEAKLKELANLNLDVNDNQKADNIYFPSVEFNAIYLLRHCAAHFASTEMTVRQVLDWGLFMEKNHQEINWDEYLPYIKQEGMFRFYNLLGLFCVRHLGFNASIFHGLDSDELFERFRNEIMEPEFKDRENGNLLWSLWVKPRRWWHNRWKNRLCYIESAWEEFVYGLWAKVLKPSHFIQ